MRLQDPKGFIESLNFLSQEDKNGLLFLVTNSPLGATYPDLQFSENNSQVARWQSCVGYNNVEVSKHFPEHEERIYKIRGVGPVHAPVEVLYEMVTNTTYLEQWDPLLKKAEYVYRSKGDYPILHIGYAYSLYKAPGLSVLCSDRDCFVKMVSLILPDGTRVVLARSPESHENVPVGVPSVPRGTIRSHVGQSGFVLSPHEGGTLMTMVLQMDPKGWVPASVVSCCSMMIPMNIQRVRKAVSRLSVQEVDRIVHRERLDPMAYSRQIERLMRADSDSMESSASSYMIEEDSIEGEAPQPLEPSLKDTLLASLRARGKVRDTTA